MHREEAEILIDKIINRANSLADVKEWYSRIDEFGYNPDYQRLLQDDYTRANDEYRNAKAELLFHLCHSTVTYDETNQ